MPVPFVIADEADRRRSQTGVRAAAGDNGLRVSLKESLFGGVDFENWYLWRQANEGRPASAPHCGDHVECRSSVGSSENFSHTYNLVQGALTNARRGSSTIKRARRNSSGQRAGQLELCRGPSDGMNLQSTGQTAAVGKGYLQSTGHPPNSLSGECPWFLQNPGVALHNNPPLPPTAPLRQHKRPAPQPGSQFPTGTPHLPSHTVSTRSAFRGSTYNSAVPAGSSAPAHGGQQRTPTCHIGPVASELHCHPTAAPAHVPEPQSHQPLAQVADPAMRACTRRRQQQSSSTF